MARIGAWFAVVLCLIAAARVGADSSVTRPLARARVELAVKAIALADVQYKSGSGDLEHLYRWTMRWCDAQRDDKGALPAAAAQEHLKRMRELEVAVKQRASAGVATALDAIAAEYYRTEAELLAANAK